MTPHSMIFAGLFDPSTVWIFIPVSAIVLGIGCGAISMMLEHQRKMAQIMRGQNDEETRQSIDALRQEIGQLRSMLDSALRGSPFGHQELNLIEPETPTLQAKLRE